MRGMAKKPVQEFIQMQDPCPGPYDREESDLPWFLPGDTPDPEAAPLPRADRRPLVDPRAWAAAQGDLAAELAGVAVLFGALDERLRAAPAGWRQRLALLEAAELSWWVGDRISAERLGLWSALRLSGVQQDSQGLARADWALRRLSGGPGPGADRETLAGFLARQGAEGVEDLAALSDDLALLHPVTRAAALFHGWHMLADAGQAGPTRGIEAAVLAARLAADMGRASTSGGALFLPLALSGMTGVQGGPERARLASFLRGAERATLAALLHLDRLAAWSHRAASALADLQGRTPGLLIAALAEAPMVTAPLLQRQTGASRAAVLRNLALMQARGLIREVTGQGRYRVWAARL